MSDDPVTTLRALSSWLRNAPADDNQSGELADALAAHADGVIERHVPVDVAMDRPRQECYHCFAEDWPCPDVRELLAVAEAIGLQRRHAQ
jgi:hypothetical protein